MIPFRDMKLLRITLLVGVLITTMLLMSGCRRSKYAAWADRDAYGALSEGQAAALGGLIGVILACFVPSLLKDIVDVTPIVSVPMLIGPLLMAIAVGVVSGLYPARRAASLDPIEALRHE